jgi:accessory gene regulator protein AgrB
MIISQCAYLAQSLIYQDLQGILSLISNNEENKMQTYDTHSANHAQNYPNQSNGIIFIILFSVAIFFFIAVQKHLITDFFVYLLSFAFDSFTIKSHSITADIIILAVLLLALFGLFCFVKFFFSLFVTVAIIGVIALAAFYFDAFDYEQPHEAKLKNNEAIERNYAPFGG